MTRPSPKTAVKDGKQYPDNSCVLYVRDSLDKYMEDNITPAFMKLTDLAETIDEKMDDIKLQAKENSDRLDSHMEKEDQDRKYILIMLGAMCTIALSGFGWLLIEVESIHSGHDIMKISSGVLEEKIERIEKDIEKIKEDFYK